MISKLRLKNVGPIKQADIDFNNLTIISGRNGVGKTYLSYTYFMLVEWFSNEVREIVKVPKKLEDAVWEMASTSFVGQKSVEVDLEELNISMASLSSALSAASQKKAIFKQLDLSDEASENAIIQGIIEDSYFNKIIKKKAQGRLRSDIDYRISKEKGSTIIKADFIKESAEELDESAILNLSFILKIFITEELLGLNQFPITSERTGISLFHAELSEKSGYQYRLEGAETPVRYSRPIEINIANYRFIKNRRSSYNHWLFNGKPGFQKQVSSIVGGQYEIDDKEIYFSPKGQNIRVPLKSSSGASKSLILLDYFLHMYKAYGSLIIDEPELNLHLDSQKEIAQVLCSIANQGINVIVTTHSDHFIREVNNLIMLSSPKLKEHQRQEILKKSGISKDAIISPKKVSTVVISSKERKTYSMPISEYGIDLQLFNEEIMRSNDITQELMTAIYEAEDD